MRAAVLLSCGVLLLATQVVGGQTPLIANKKPLRRESPLVVDKEKHEMSFAHEKAFSITNPRYDVTIYGAKCDSTVDSTQAFVNARNDALAGNGILYAPTCPNDQPYAVNESFLTNTNTMAWLIFLDENDLYITGGSASGVNIAVVGRGNQHEGIAGEFVTQSHVDWIAASPSVSALSVDGIDQMWVEGVAFFSTYYNTVPVADLHTNTSNGRGVVYVTFKGDEFISGDCSRGRALIIHPDASRPKSAAGFGIFFSGVSIGGPSTTDACAEFDDIGDITFGDGLSQNSFQGGGIIVDDSAIGSGTSYTFRHILSESFGGTSPAPFIRFIPGPGTIEGINVDGVGLADPVGPVYVIGGFSDQNGNVAGTLLENEVDVGNGVFDPSSTANFFGVECLYGPCYGLRVKGSNSVGLLGYFGIDSQAGHDPLSLPVYIGNSSSTGPALEVDTPRHAASILLDQGSQIKPARVEDLQACSAALEGTRRAVTDSQSAVAGSPLTGYGTYHVPVYCNGTIWTVD